MGFSTYQYKGCKVIKVSVKRTKSKKKSIFIGKALNSIHFSSSIVCGILFWTSISAVVSITKLIALLIQWSPTKFDPEIEAVSALDLFPEEGTFKQIYRVFHLKFSFKSRSILHFLKIENKIYKH